MPEEESEETRRRHRRAMSPEMRRFLGQARTLQERTGKEGEPSAPEETEPEEMEVEEAAAPEPRIETKAETARPQSIRGRRAASEPAGVVLAPAKKLSRKVEMQTVALILGSLGLVGGAFYVGKKFDRWRYEIMMHNQPKLTDPLPAKFQALAVDDLVEQALAAQRLGNWQDASERFVAAKYKNLGYRGILFRLAKIHWDHNDFDTADKFFEQAISFGENVDTANYYRGLIAIGRGNYPGAIRFFEAAATAEPFNPSYPYYWAEALRRGRQPTEAIAVYERALARFDGDQDRTVCQFKIRMAKIESGDGASVAAEVETKRQLGALTTPDWLMTDAALRIREGNIPDAVGLIDKARTADFGRLYSLFASCASDMLFAGASEKNPEIAKACEVGALAVPPAFRH